MVLTFDMFKILAEKNEDFLKTSSKVLAKKWEVEIEVIKDYREKLKASKGYLFEPTVEQLESTNYKIEIDSRVPIAPKGFLTSSFKEGSTWFKRDDTVILEDNSINWGDVAKEISKSTKPAILNTINNKEEIHKLVCISDIHCGMLTEGWGLEEMNACFTKIGNSIEKCDGVTILFLGDGIDGLNKMTQRMGHKLPQNMSNQEQVLNLVKGFQILFDKLAQLKNEGIINSFDFESVYESNHSGDMDYVVAKFLEMWLNTKYPDVECKISKDVWNLFIINEKFDIFYTHGKDANDQKFGHPLNLNEKTELYITHVLKERFEEFNMNPKTTLVISGDLHTQSFNQGKFFKYYKVPAMSPSSSWVKANYGSSIPGCQYFNFYKDSFETGVIEF